MPFLAIMSKTVLIINDSKVIIPYINYVKHISILFKVLPAITHRAFTSSVCYPLSDLLHT